jgi:uncharacterized protein YjbI with pentapeptide repeats
VRRPLSKQKQKESRRQRNTQTLGQPNSEQPTSQPKTLYSEIKAKLENNRWVVVLLIASVVVAGAAAFVKNLGEIAGLFRGADPAGLETLIAAAAKNLADASPVLRINGAQDLERVGKESKDLAGRCLSELKAFLEREANISGTVRQPQERDDVGAALKAFGVILETADKKNWPVKKPDLEKLNLSGLDLSDLYLRGVSITDTSFEEAVLSRADLSQAKLYNVRFDRAQAQNVKLNGSQIKWSCMEEVDLTGADLRFLDSEDSDLNSAVFEDADLSGARLYRTRVANAKFKNADLSSTDLSDALEIAKGQLEKARTTQGTKLPDPLYKRLTLAACGPRG